MNRTLNSVVQLIAVLSGIHLLRLGGVGGAIQRRLSPIRWAAKVTLQELGSLGEFVAAIATLGTLVYLSIQIRANTVALRAESRRSATDHGLHMQGVIGGRTETASVFRRGLNAPDELTPDESLQFQFLFSMVASQADNIFVDFELGSVQKPTMESSLEGISRLLHTPGGRWYWKMNSSDHTPGFRAHISQKLSESPSSAVQQATVMDCSL
jgi:hypothetical protein